MFFICFEVSDIHSFSLSAMRDRSGVFTGAYLAVVTKASTAARCPGGQGGIQRVDKLELIPLCTEQLASAELRADEAEYLRMIHSVVARSAFFFSDTWDLTHTLQRRTAFGMPGGAIKPGCPAQDLRLAVPAHVQASRAEPRFWWNAHLSQELLQAGAAAFLVVCINGFVESRLSQSVDGQRVDVTLISRRSCRRQGTRFTVRGIDTCGNVANYVESEQLISFTNSDKVVSFVQTRGSIPLVWSQPVCIRYTPKCSLAEVKSPQSQVLFQRHMQEQFDKYGSVTAVNLIDTKGDQQVLGEAYKAAADRLSSPALTYVWFDFHKECKGMKYGNLAKLMHSIASNMERSGVFTQAGGVVQSIQSGVVRTNCMDNLDRTNVVQSLIARWALLFAVQGKSSLADANADVLSSPFPAFERQFKALWADHADAMSNLYSGTGALKTDFTRTGKRTLAGAMQDGHRSLVRYFLANFEDGRTQDAWDLFLGRFVPVSQDAPDPQVVHQWAEQAAAGDNTRPAQPVVVRHSGMKRGSPLASFRGDTSTKSFVGRTVLLMVGMLVAFTAVAQGVLGGGAGSSAGTVTSAAEGSIFGQLWGLASPSATAAMYGAGGTAAAMGVLMFLFTKKGTKTGFQWVSQPHFLHHDLINPPRKDIRVFGSDAEAVPATADKATKSA